MVFYIIITIVIIIIITITIIIIIIVIVIVIVIIIIIIIITTAIIIIELLKQCTPPQVTSVPGLFLQPCCHRKLFYYTAVSKKAISARLALPFYKSPSHTSSNSVYLPHNHN